MNTHETNLKVEKNRSHSVILWSALVLLAGPILSANAADDPGIGNEQPSIGTGILSMCGDVGWGVDEFWCDAVFLPETAIGTPENGPMVPAVDAVPPITYTGVRRDGRSLYAPYPIGCTIIDWTAVDNLGQSGACSQEIYVYNDPLQGGCPTPQFATMHLRDTVLEVRNKYNKDLAKFNAAYNYLNKAQDPNRWIFGVLEIGDLPIEGPVGEAIFSNGKSAAGQLVPIKGKYYEVVAILYRLVDADRQIADFVIRKGPPNASKILTAKKYLAKGEAHVLLQQFTEAIDDYKNAWKNAAAAY